MKYFKDTIAYLFRYGKGRRFLTLFLLSLIPTASLAYAHPFSAYTDFLFGFVDGNYPNFSALWLDTFRHDAYSLIGLALSFVLFVPFTAYVAKIITRSIRVGEFGLTKIISSVNENFFPAVTVITFYFFSAFLFHNLFILLAFLFLQIKARVFGLILTVAVFIGLSMLLFYIWSSMTLWLPTMSFSGQYVTKAFLGSFSNAKSYQKTFFIPRIIIFAFLALVSLGVRFINVWYVQWIINTLCLALIYTFIVPFSAVAYCDSRSITREDMARRYFGR